MMKRMNMTRRMLIVLGVSFVMAACTGCSDEDKGDKPLNNESSIEISDQENTENTKDTENQTSSETTQKLKVPRTKEEMEAAFGAVDEKGNWTPPEGSYVDPKTGNIMNKDGVLVGTTQKPYYNARPGSQG